MNEQNEKQAIEEIAKVIEVTEQIARDAHCGLPSPTMYAKDLYWHGYRRQSENVIELPYKVGQTVYVLRSQTSNGKNLYLRKEQIDHYRIFGERSYMCFFSDRLSVPNYLWETTVFLTQEEAEAKMKGGE